MKICGCAPSISYSAVVPLLGWPTMKKSGNRVPARLPLARASAETIVTPQRYQVAPEVFAERHHLGLEAASQRDHELLVDGGRVGIEDALLRGPHKPLAQPLGSHALDRLLERHGRGTRSYGDRVQHLVHARCAHAHGRVCM